MEKQASSRVDQIGVIARRIPWALLILVHLPVLASVGRSVVAEPGTANLPTWFALCLTVFVFVLKLLDVRILRFRTRRGAVLVFLLACALVHHEVALSRAGQAVINTAPAALVTGLLIEGLHRARRHLPRVCSRMGATLARALVAARLYGMAAADALRVLQASLLSQPCLPRGPPR